MISRAAARRMPRGDMFLKYTRKDSPLNQVAVVHRWLDSSRSNKAIEFFDRAGISAHASLWLVEDGNLRVQHKAIIDAWAF